MLTPEWLAHSAVRPHSCFFPAVPHFYTKCPPTTRFCSLRYPILKKKIALLKAIKAKKIKWLKSWKAKPSEPPAPPPPSDPPRSPYIHPLLKKKLYWWKKLKGGGR